MIAVVGEALIDAHLDGGVLRVFPGGGPFNTAVALARLGVPVCFCGALSRDRFGRLLEERLSSVGVVTSGSARVDAPTPIAIVDRDELEPSYSFYLAGTAHEALQAPQLRGLPYEVTALHVGTLALATDPPGSVVETFAELEARRRALMLDPNVRPTLISNRRRFLQRVERLAALAAVVKLSGADAQWLYPGSTTPDAAQRLLGLGAGCVVVTHGRAGAEGWTRSGTAHVATPAVAVVDTIGAGDAFGAGLLAWLWRALRLKKRSLERLRPDELQAALAYSAAAGAAQCTRPSAWGPTAADVERLLDPTSEHAPTAAKPFSSS